MILKKQHKISDGTSRFYLLETMNESAPPGSPTSAQAQAQTQVPGVPGNPVAITPSIRRHSWEYIEEILALLKTAFPLLALSMETMVDQILQRLKPSADEDIYRLVVALLNDGVSMFLQQLARDPAECGTLSQATEMNLLRFADSMHPNHMKVILVLIF